MKPFRRQSHIFVELGLAAIIWCNIIFLSCSAVSPATSTPVGNLQHVYTKTSTAAQRAAAQDVLQRVIPTRFADFKIAVDKNLTASPYEDAFQLEWRGPNEVHIRGTTAVAALQGFHHYLKYFCNCHIAWEGAQLDLPLVLPKVSWSQRIYDRFRYYQNVCTDSYSFVWWKWADWEKHIDWMALNGINLPLAFTGQEAVWVEVYQKLGVPKEDVLDYISGPAFLAWWRMGNIQKWGGPLPAKFLQGKKQLLVKIVDRMHSLGMLPVFPAFAGSVPEALVRLYPNSTFGRHPAWNKFNSSYSSNFVLTPTDPLFVRIGQMFIQELTAIVKTAHVYSCDTFNENRPASGDPEFLRSMARATFASMAAADPKAVWMIQSWTFTDKDFWNKQRVQSYLSGVQQGNAIILDLEAELFPQYAEYDSFFNHTFIWCMLHNFGGNHGLYGALGLVNQGVDLVRKEYLNQSRSIEGTGICPEGINQNYVVYDFMLESSLRAGTVNVSSWVEDYQYRRYGTENKDLRQMWLVLAKRIYNAPARFRYHGRSLITRRPGVALGEKTWYNIQDINATVSLGLAAIQNVSNVSKLLTYDLVDFTRQYLQVLGVQLYRRMMRGFKKRNINYFNDSAEQLLEALRDMDKILATDERFLLGPWVSSTQTWASDVKEKALLRYNALNQITLWGPKGEIVDYASKMWAGLFEDYYLPRWSLFIDQLRSSFNTSFDTESFNAKVLRTVEVPFTFSDKMWPHVPTGNTIECMSEILHKWNPVLEKVAEGPFRSNKWQKLRKSFNGRWHNQPLST